jgi:hypothetical protein
MLYFVSFFSLSLSLFPYNVLSIRLSTLPRTYLIIIILFALHHSHYIIPFQRGL